MGKIQGIYERDPNGDREMWGKFIARGGEVETLEGPEEILRVVLIEFPSLAKAKEFYNSPEYQEARKLRAGVTTGQLLAIDGVQ